MMLHNIKGKKKKMVTFVSTYESCACQKILTKILLKDEQKFVFQFKNMFEQQQQ